MFRAEHRPSYWTVMFAVESDDTPPKFRFAKLLRALWLLPSISIAKPSIDRAFCHVYKAADTRIRAFVMVCPLTPVIKRALTLQITFIARQVCLKCFISAKYRWLCASARTINPSAVCSSYYYYISTTKASMHELNATKNKIKFFFIERLSNSEIDPSGYILEYLK